MTPGTDISDVLDALHSDPSPVSRIVSKILDDVTGRWPAAWDTTAPRLQAEIVEHWERLVHEALADADTTVSPSGMIRVHVQPSGGDRDRMAAEARTVIAALTQAFLPPAEARPPIAGTFTYPAIGVTEPLPYNATGAEIDAAARKDQVQ